MTGGGTMDVSGGNLVVLGVALLVWGLLFAWLVRLDRRVRDLEKR